MRSGSSGPPYFATQPCQTCGHPVRVTPRTGVQNFPQILKARRLAARLSLSALAAQAGISKTYLWELEQGRKNPSVNIVIRLADALATTVADLLGETAGGEKPRVPPSLIKFKNRMIEFGEPLSEQDVRDLAAVRFRGHRPRTTDDWHALYLMMHWWNK